jgi:hypothetical protein
LLTNYWAAARRKRYKLTVSSALNESTHV